MEDDWNMNRYIDKAIEAAIQAIVAGSVALIGAYFDKKSFFSKII